MKKLTLTLLFLALLLTACGTASTSTPEPLPATETTPDVVTAEGKLLPAPSVELAFVQGGIVAEVLVEPGQPVAAGDALARLENSETLQAEVARAQEAFLLAGQAFNASEAQALQDLAAAHEAVRKAQYELDYFDIPSDLRQMTTDEALVYTREKLDQARAAFEPYRYLEERLEYELKQMNPNKEEVYRGTAKIYKRRLDDAWADYNRAIRWAELESNLESAQADLENAQEEFEALTSGKDAGDMAIARARYETARANLEAARAALSNAELRAPFAGTVLSLDISAGDVAAPGVPVVFLADTAAWTVETKDLAEIDISRVALGQPARVELDAFPGETFAGTVTEIDPVGREYLGDMTYKVTITLEEADPRFLWNMTAVVTIEVE
ncbi:MAG: HlyD family secretion protein [Chloroflexota bacterium]